MSTLVGHSSSALSSGNCGGKRAVGSFHIESRTVRLSSTETEAARRDARDEIESSPRSREMLRVLNAWFDSATEPAEVRAGGV